MPNRIIQYYNLVSQIYNNNILGVDKAGLEYLLKRGISKFVIKKYMVGYAKSGNQLPRNFPNFILNDSKLFYEDGNEVFQNAIMFPCFYGDDVIFYSSRSLPGYNGIPHKHLRGKIPCVYNANALVNNGSVFVVEGCIDTLTLLTHGKNAVGLLGANRLNDEIAKDFKGIKVFLLLDNDQNSAGQKASLRNAGIFQRNNIEVWIIFLPDANKSYDINDFFLEHGMKEFNYMVKNSIPYTSTEDYKENKYKRKNIEYNSGSVDINLVLSHYKLTGRENGFGIKINCPFPDHIDKQASMQIYKNTNTFYCFGACARAGNAIDLIKFIEKIPYNKAIEIYKTISSIPKESI